MNPPARHTPPQAGPSRVIQGSFPGGRPRILQLRSAPAPAQPARPAPPPAMPARPMPGRPAAPIPNARAHRPAALQPAGAGNAFSLPPSFRLRPAGTGQRLPEAVQRKMEGVLGADFSGVRVHVGPEASSIGALAFTVGSDLYFAPGQYNPGSSQGQQLLGHELTHVVQQRAGRVRGPMGSVLAVVQDAALEAEADRVGQRAAAAAATVQAKPARPLPSVAPLKAEGPGWATARSNGSALPARLPVALAIQRMKMKWAIPPDRPTLQAKEPGSLFFDHARCRIGVGADKRAMTSSTPRIGTSPVIQRAVVVLDDNKDDYALQKVLTGLEPGRLVTLRDGKDVEWFAQERAGDPSLRAMIPYRNLMVVAKAIQERNGKLRAMVGSKKPHTPEVSPIAQDEDIYIVGHGRSDLVWTSPGHGGEVEDFTSLGKYLKWATPEDWDGTTRFLTCNSEREDTPRPKTVTGQLEVALGGRLAVGGQPGFAYGMGVHGPVKVLKQEFEDLYNPNPQDFNPGIGEYLTKLAFKTPQAAAVLNYTPPANQVENNGEWKKVWNRFVGKMKEIQDGLDAEVRKIAGTDILAKAQSLKHSQTFQSLILEQFRLFEAFKLWR